MTKAAIAAVGLVLALPAEAQDRSSVAPKNMQQIAPALAGYTDRVVFGDVWLRPDGDQLAFHIRRGLENGLTRAQIVEAFTNLAFYAGWPKATAASGVAAKVFGNQETAMSDIQIVHPNQEPKPGPTDYFSGAVSVASPFKGTGDARLGGATVTFQPGARTNWHTHPLGQLLIVTQGTGWVQAEGKSVQEMHPRDAVWIAPGVKHWHGAARTSAVTHVAVAEALDGQTVTWLEPVSEADYHGPR